MRTPSCVILELLGSLNFLKECFFKLLDFLEFKKIKKTKEGKRLKETKKTKSAKQTNILRGSRNQGSQQFNTGNADPLAALTLRSPPNTQPSHPATV